MRDFPTIDELLSNAQYISRFNTVKNIYANNEHIRQFFNYIEFITNPNNNYFYDKLPIKQLYVFVRYIMNHEDELTVYVLAESLCIASGYNLK